MQTLPDGALILTATDVTSHLACAHLTQQWLAVAREERPKPRPANDPHAELVQTRGEQHEQEQLARLSAACGGDVADLSATSVPRTRADLEALASTTAEAMRAGTPLIYQAQLFDGRWQGRPDFLRRVSATSALGAHAYEVVDAKLARQVKPQAVHQVSLYNRLLVDVQHHDTGWAHVVLGDGTEVPLDVRRYAALHRHVTLRFQSVAEAPAVATYPEPVAHCAVCSLADECRERHVADDHLSLVAGARRDQREQLVQLGFPTLRALAEAPAAADPRPLGADRFRLLRRQACLQLESRMSGKPTHDHLPASRGSGYALLPPPSAGDVFFDLEGDPYVADGGIEYLWGWWTAEAGYEYQWAHDPDAEKAAFEQFIDRVCEMRERHPTLHVYHYAPHELSQLRSLSVRYATREAEVDELLRAEVLVDLYAVVRRALQIGEEGYSRKQLERHHGVVRSEREVRAAGGSIVAYETWLQTGDDALLEAIRAYNEDDCASTRSLREWLLGTMRPEAEAELKVDFGDYAEPEPEEERGPPEWMPGALALIGPLTTDLPAHGLDDAGQAERRLVAHLILYHWREDKPTWWRWFDLRDKSSDALLDDRDAIAGIAPDPNRPPVDVKRSRNYHFTFPTQEFRLKPGAAEDPTTGESFKVVAVEDGRLVLRCGARQPPPAPIALVDATFISVRVLREALMTLAESLLAEEERFAATRAILRREPPRLTNGALNEDMDALVAATLALDRSVLPVQGPPGTGKTFRAARMIVSALAAGHRVGITAPSHAAIQNLLAEVECCAHEQGRTIDGIYKGEDYDSPHGLVGQTSSNDGVTSDHELVAGTAWLFARPEHREVFDLLFIDEAGQFSLANAAAVGLAASSVVLLGDPQQLPQVTQTDHPDGSGASVLAHLLAGASTIPPERGVLLTETWRMHPGVCAFVSERSYDSRLRSRAGCEQRQIDASRGSLRGAGLRTLAVEHTSRSQASPEEAAIIAAACRDLLDGDATVTDDVGATRPITPRDIVVVAPYNLAVRCIHDRVPTGVRVGTVDRFQGQQAPVVFYALTSSSGEDVPRGIDFLFDTHRLNVSVSRAQCLAVLVHSPRLLDADCATLKSMAQLDGLCRFVELAREGG